MLIQHGVTDNGHTHKSHYLGGLAMEPSGVWTAWYLSTIVRGGETTRSLGIIIQDKGESTLITI